MTTRVRFAVFASLVAAVAVLAAGVTAAVVIERSLTRVVDQRLVDTLDEVQRAARAGDPCPAVGTGGSSGARVVSVVHATGRELCRSSFAAPSPRALGIPHGRLPGGGPRTVPVEGEPWRVASRQVREGTLAVAAESIAARDAARRDATQALLMSMFAGVALAALAGAAAAGRATRRIDRLLARIEQAGADPTGTARVGRVGGSDLDAAARSFDGLLDRLRESDLAQRRLLADAAHELRTPVTSIRTNAQLLERSVAAGSDEHDMARRIARQSAVIADLVSGLVDHAAVTAWSRDGRDQALAPIVQGAVERAVERWPEAPIIASKLDDSSAVVDVELVSRALGNLLDNALVHGVAPVEVTLHEGVVSVADAGSGFDPQIVDDAFEPFASGGARGSGLGLAFVRHVARAHGGDARISSTLPARVEVWFHPGGRPG